MHKDFLREITEKSCTDEMGARKLFREIMEKLPDDAIMGALPVASALLTDLKDEIEADPKRAQIIQGYTHMLNELANEMQRRMVKKVSG